MKKYHKSLSFLTKFIGDLNSQKNSKGFTLIELLIAASLTTIVVSLTGFGLVTIMGNNKVAKAQTDRRVELNRALDFITDEIRQARPISTNASANLSTVAPTFISSGKTPVLTLQIPGVAERVIYYIASASSPWLGPNVVYRWGPNFTASGQYNTTAPSGWTYDPLVDLIVNITPDPNPNCPTNWVPNPAVASRTGFYSCVDPAGKSAEIYLRGQLINAVGSSVKPFQVSTTAFARPYTPTFTTGSGSSTSSGNSGTVTVTQPSTMYIQVLGGSITCGAGGVIVPTTTTINVTPSGGTTTSTVLPSSTQALNLSANPGTTLTITGSALTGTCSGFGGSSYNSNTHNGSQVLTLRNGDRPPLFSPFGSQPTIDTFLTRYLDPATGRITIADNQVIFLYELGATSSSSEAYDMQDLVVLATIAAK